MELNRTSLPDPKPPRHPVRLALSALCAVVLVITAAAAAFQSAAAPHAAAYALPEPTAAQSTTPPVPRQLQRLTTPEPILAALAAEVAKGPARRIRAASVLCQLEVWTRHEDMMTAQRITSWRSEDGSGYVATLTLPSIASSAFHPSMVARTSLETAAYQHQTYGPGQMPFHSQWPATLGTDPQTMIAQLEVIRPGIDTPAELMRALSTAHTRYVVTRETRAATLMLLASTSGITVRQTEIPNYAMHNPPMPGLVISAQDVEGSVTFQMMADIGYLVAAIEHTYRGGAGSRRTTSHTVFLLSQDRIPDHW